MSAVNYHDIEISDEVIAAVDSGRNVDAVKILREQSGLGLTDAKQVVNLLTRERSGVPDAATAIEAMEEEGGAGGMIRTVLVIGAILGIYFYFVAG